MKEDEEQGCAEAEVKKPRNSAEGGIPHIPDEEFTKIHDKREEKVEYINQIIYTCFEINQVRRVGADEDCSIANGLTSTR
jgi:hypothetical protein